MNGDVDQLPGLVSEINDDKTELVVPIKGFKKYYFFLIVFGGLVSISGGLFLICAGMVVGWALAYLITNGIAGFRVLKMNFKTYPLKIEISNDELYEQLNSVFNHPDFKVGIRKNGVYFIFKGRSQHRIWIDSKKNEFSIISKMRSSISNKHNLGIKELMYAYAATPIIIPAINNVLLLKDTNQGHIEN